jgi:hypothetical protein
MYAQYGAVVSTIAIEIVVTTVIVNFFLSLRGQMDKLRTNLPLRWFYTGMVFYFVTCLQCSIQVLLTVQKIIHFTDWVVGHAHLVMFGVFGFWLLGITTYLWPKVTGRAWWSQRLNHWHYWLTTAGMVVMFLDLLVAGVVQGFQWRSLAPWEESLIASVPFWLIRTFSGDRARPALLRLEPVEVARRAREGAARPLLPARRGRARCARAASGLTATRKDPDREPAPWKECAPSSCSPAWASSRSPSS